MALERHTSSRLFPFFGIRSPDHACCCATPAPLQSGSDVPVPSPTHRFAEPIAESQLTR